MKKNQKKRKEGRNSQKRGKMQKQKKKFRF